MVDHMLPTFDPARPALVRDPTNEAVWNGLASRRRSIIADLKCAVCAQVLRKSIRRRDQSCC
jgi:hypothetical protein